MKRMRTLLLPCAAVGLLLGPAAALSSAPLAGVGRPRAAALPSELRAVRDDDERGGTTAAAGAPTRRAALRQLLAGTLASNTLPLLPSAASAVVDASVVPAPPSLRATTWPLGKVAFSLLPLAGTYTRRATVMETLVDDGTNGIWTFDQIQGVVNVNVPVRMVVVKLSAAAGGGLWIHNPLAPTPQLISYVRQLEAVHGPVRHVVLGTVALEHKATLGPFSQYFPQATVWVHPGQWSFPVQLPVQYLGVVQRDEKLRTLPSSQYLHGERTLEEELQSLPGRNDRYWAKKGPVPEWTADFDYEMLGPLRFQSVGAYGESAFFHRPTKSLIVTDSVCSVTKDPPKVIQEDPRALLFHARNSIDEVVEDNEATRQRGWRRMVQFGLVFFPSQIDVVPFGEAIAEAGKIDPSMRSLGEGAVPGALYPWTWSKGSKADEANFDAISQNGKLFCPPILTKLILDREPQKTLEWADRVAERFDFEHVIGGHLNNYVKANKKEFREAFDPLRSNPKGGKVYPQRALPEDLALLQEASDLLTKFGVVGESQVCDLEPARTVGRFAAIANK
ncbi:hypothetical protein ACHAXT_003754 [Thalassiosira profunda]